MSGHFCSAGFLREQGPEGLTKQIERLLGYLRFTAIFNIDGAGDGGGDIIANRKGDTWVIQSKWKKSAAMGREGVDEVFAAIPKYHAKEAVVVTNSTASPDAQQRANKLSSLGAPIQMWDGQKLAMLWRGADMHAPEIELRGYQQQAVDAMWSDLESTDRALLLLATGLGKTIVAGELVRRTLARKPDAQILVVAHAKDLVAQLERAFWKHLPKTVRTQLVDGDKKTDDLQGVTFATLQTALSYVQSGYAPELVVVDEAHHVGGDGQYSELLERLRSAKQFGVTATPWRGDGYDLSDRFGDPSFSLGITDGMRLGYLADVDYRVFADNLDWDFVRAHSENEYTIKDLNAKLFIPERDEAIRDRLISAWEETKNPRAIVFCRTIEHAERMAALLGRVPQFRNALAIHGGMPKRERQARLLSFRNGETPIITSVDVLNEGVDVPDVNILCFARVTHSRRIFVQQLGRGLRLSKTKDKVIVLDFISDVRRLAAVKGIRSAVHANELEVVNVARNRFMFDDLEVESLMEEWLQDAAEIEDAADDARLQFPLPECP